MFFYCLFEEQEKILGKEWFPCSDPCTWNSLWKYLKLGDLAYVLVFEGLIQKV